MSQGEFAKASKARQVWLYEGKDLERSFGGDIAGFEGQSLERTLKENGYLNGVVLRDRGRRHILV
jgi:hypothetical protein